MENGNDHYFNMGEEEKKKAERSYQSEKQIKEDEERKKVRINKNDKTSGKRKAKKKTERGSKLFLFR